jgi:LacI family transcriptional regulator
MKTDTITIRDIARQMGVAHTTVARALNGEPGVNAQRAEEIRALASELGYCAKPFRRQRTHAIGFLVGAKGTFDADDDVTRRLVFLVEKIASELDLHLHVELVTRDESDGESVLPAFIRKGRVDAVIAASHPPASILKRIQSQGIPVVLINDTVERTGCTCVSSDASVGMHDAIRGLVNLGHRAIGLAVADVSLPTMQRRLAVYREELRTHGLELNPALIVEGLPADLEGGQQAITTFLERGELPTAILFGNDWQAMGGLYELARRGFDVPGRVSVVGHDNVWFCEQIGPALTTIDPHHEESVRWAVRYVLDQLEKPAQKPVQHYTPSRLVWRESCRGVLNGARPESQGISHPDKRQKTC